MTDEQLKEATGRNVYLLQTDNDRLMEIIKKIKEFANTAAPVDSAHLLSVINSQCDKALRLK